MNTSRSNILSYLACYAIWVVLGLATLGLIVLVRTNVLDFVYLTDARPMMVAFVDRIAVIPLVIIAIAVIIVLEHTLREAVPQGTLWPRAGKAALIIFGIAAASALLHFFVVTIRVGGLPAP
jgi:hypothetical protein